MLQLTPAPKPTQTGSSGLSANFTYDDAFATEALTDGPHRAATMADHAVVYRYRFSNDIGCRRRRKRCGEYRETANHDPLRVIVIKCSRTYQRRP